jgi:DNA polymerase (family 10)
MKKDEIADELDEYAEFLKLDGQTGRAHAYEKAARSVRTASYLPPNPARLDGIGSSTREIVIDLENDQGIEELDELRERYPWYDAFREVKHIGPARAKTIHETFNVSSLDRLELVAREGDLQLINGIGPKTEEKIKRSIAELRE